MRSVVRLYPGPPNRFQISDCNFRFAIGHSELIIGFKVLVVSWVELGAGWSSPVARWAHNPKVAGSNPAPATKFEIAVSDLEVLIRGV